MLEKLKYKKELKEHTLHTVTDRTANGDKKTVKEILKVLEEKYSKTYSEKTMEIIEKMMNFKITESETYETVWDKFINFQTEYDKLELSKHPHFML